MSKENYRIVFHGTNKEDADSILKGGFRANTYFAQNLADSLEFGGEYIFYVALPDSICGNNWQPRPDTLIPAENITRLIKVNPELVFDNPKAREKFFGPYEKYPCPNCGENIGGVSLSLFGKPTNPTCPRCKKPFDELFQGKEKP